MITTGECVKILLAGLHDDSGNELSGGKVYTYDAGTTNDKATYTDRALTTPAANPIVLDANGKAQVYAAADALYKFVVKTSANVTLTGGTWDNLKFGSLNINKGTNVVSEAALFTAAGFPTDGAYFDVTGTTGITSMLTSGKIGSIVILHYDGALTITQDGDNIITPGAQDITTIAGDVIMWAEHASGKWEVISWTRSNYIESSTIESSTIESSTIESSTIKTPTIDSGITLNGNAWPSFSVYRGADQLNIAGATKIKWIVEVFDTNSDFEHDADDSGGATESRFTPTVAGKYLLSCTLTWDNTIDGDVVVAKIYKNGAVDKVGGQQASSTNTRSTVTAIVDANGTTDYFEIYGENFARDTSDVNGTDRFSYWTGCRIG